MGRGVILYVTPQCTCTNFVSGDEMTTCRNTIFIQQTTCTCILLKDWRVWEKYNQTLMASLNHSGQKLVVLGLSFPNLTQSVVIDSFKSCQIVLYEPNPIPLPFTCSYTLLSNHNIQYVIRY